MSDTVMHSLTSSLTVAAVGEAKWVLGSAKVSKGPFACEEGQTSGGQYSGHHLSKGLEPCDLLTGHLGFDRLHQDVDDSRRLTRHSSVSQHSKNRSKDGQAQSPGAYQGWFTIRQGFACCETDSKVLNVEVLLQPVIGELHTQADSQKGGCHYGKALQLCLALTLKPALHPSVAVKHLTAPHVRVVTVLGAVYLMTTLVTVTVRLKRACMNKDVKEPIHPPDAVAGPPPAIDSFQVLKEV